MGGYRRGRLARAALRRPYLAHLVRRVHKAAMPFPTMPSAAADREHEDARRHPERETLELATACAAQVLGVEHSATKALARASITMDKVDPWRARLAVKTLRRDPPSTHSTFVLFCFMAR